MGHSWDDYERAGDQGPVAFGLKVMGGMAILAIAIGCLGYLFGFWGQAMDVAIDEVGPKALLKKYQWFKDASAQLDKKTADIKVYESRFKSMEDGYKGTPRVQWPRDDREQYNLWQSEVAGIKASYNGLAAEYNSNMSKINWAFCNKGELPKGADQPLPREYKPYVTQ
jgi:hypothetical protein